MKKKNPKQTRKEQERMGERKEMAKYSGKWEEKDEHYKREGKSFHSYECS